ncbi:hypothetical protein HQ487_02900 [Candidatus Uhrbacteria bacterium]|nr:hypothetical protein [Candidatus Uhrbacteria bacterium]
MNESHKTPEFLKNQGLYKDPSVERSFRNAARDNKALPKEERRNLPDKKDIRIQEHFRRIDQALEKKGDLFKILMRKRLLQEYPISLYKKDGTEDTEKIARLVEGLYESERDIAQRRGMDLGPLGDRFSPDLEKKYKQKLFEKREEQEHSLTAWLDYFESPDSSSYPTWFKYYVLKSLGKMGKRDRDHGTYSKRSASTLDPFPSIFRGSLAQVLDVIQKQMEGTLVPAETADTALSEQTSADDMATQTSREVLQELDRLAKKGDFPKLYAHFQNETERIRRENKEAGTKGEWMHFPKDSDPREIVALLRNKGTEWCTAGLATATDQLRRGSFDIYVTYDSEGKPTVPRIAVYVIDGAISEVRGVEDTRQNLEADFIEIARTQYKQYKGAETYEKKEADIARLAQIYEREEGQELSVEDLRFLYEVDTPLSDFGYGKHPRVTEILAGRDVREDLSKALRCRPDQISFTSEEALAGGVLFHLGNIQINNLTILPENIKLPEYVGGHFNLNRLTTLPENIKLPEYVGGQFELGRLIILHENTKLPKRIGGNLYLGSLTSLSENTILPEHIEGNLYLGKLTTLPDGFKFPSSYRRYRVYLSPEVDKSEAFEKE